MSKRNKDRNSTKHGAYSRELMLPGERRADFEELRRAHYDEFAPEGINEESVVDTLIELHWKRRRITQYDQVRLRQRNEQVRHKNEVLRVQSNLRDLAPSFSDAADAEAAELILAQLSPDYQWLINRRVPREKCDDPAQWHQDVGKFLSNIESEEQPVEGSDLFVAIVDPDLMEKEITRLNRLDEAIDARIKRLMQLKTGKQVFPSMRKDKRPEPKLINPPTDATEGPAAISKNEVEHPEPAIFETDNKKMQLMALPVPAAEQTGGVDSESVTIPPSLTEKEHYHRIHEKVDFFTERPSVELLNRFCGFCNKLENANASSNLASSERPATS